MLRYHLYILEIGNGKNKIADCHTTAGAIYGATLYIPSLMLHIVTFR